MNSCRRDSLAFVLRFVPHLGNSAIVVMLYLRMIFAIGAFAVACTPFSHFIRNAGTTPISLESLEKGLSVYFTCISFPGLLATAGCVYILCAERTVTWRISSASVVTAQPICCRKGLT